MIDFLFFTFSAMAVISAIFVVARKNPVASVVYLVITFFSLAGLFVLLDAHFIAAVQVIVYAGAIMVLFLFVIMLLNLGTVDVGDVRRGVAQVVGGAVAVGIIGVLARFFLTEEASESAGAPESGALAQALESKGAVWAVAEPLFTEYLVAFEITSALLVVAIIGAIVLARRQTP